MSAPHPIAVVDLETTGLDEHAGAVLEVGCVLLDSHTLATVSEYSALVDAPAIAVATMDDVVREMHRTSGLLDELDYRRAHYLSGRDPDSVVDPIDVVDRSFARVLDAHASGGRCVLAGSGVSHFDGRWLREHLPRSTKLLTYWSYDVGVLRRVLRDIVHVEPPDLSDRKTHRALDDARVHAEELRRTVAMLRGAGVELRRLAATTYSDAL